MSDHSSHLTQKPRGTSTIDALPEEQAEQLDHWLLEENRTYDEVVELLATNFGVKTSRSALSRYYDRALLPRRLAEDADDLALWHECDEADYETAWLMRAKQLGFHALAAREPDVATAERMFRIVTATERGINGRKRTDLEDRRVALREHRSLVWRPVMKPAAVPASKMDEVSLYRMFREMVKEGAFDHLDPTESGASEKPEKPWAIGDGSGRKAAS